MKENVRGGFLTPSEHLEGYVFVLTGQWNSNFQSYFNSGKVLGIRLSRSAGWRAESLDFLTQINTVKSIEIYNSDVKDISVLGYFTSLLHLGLECPYQAFDFSILQELQVLMLNWRRSSKSSLSISSLIYLNVLNFPDSELLSLEKLKNLERLYIQSRALKSLDGIENLVLLNRLELAYCTSLNDISELEKNSGLSHLMFHSCKNVANIDSLQNCLSLKCLNIECNNGTLDSVRVLRHCLNLEALILVGIKVKDGDLRPILALKNLKSLALANYKHHKPTRDELKNALGL